MKMAECFQKGLLKRTSPDMENALRSLELSRSNIEDAVENMSIHRYRVVAISSYSSMFHAARAILFRDGIKERSHECIPVYLKEKYPELETLANILDSYRRFRPMASKYRLYSFLEIERYHFYHCLRAFVIFSFSTKKKLNR